MQKEMELRKTSSKKIGIEEIEGVKVAVVKSIQKEIKINELPPVGYMLFEDIRGLVSKNFQYGDEELNYHDRCVIENKLIYILDAFILRFYGQPVFDATFDPMHEGPVEKEIYNIQRKKKKIPTEKSIKSRNINEDDMKVYKRIVKHILNAIDKAIDKKLIPLNASILSKLTHSKAWQKKYDQREKLRFSNDDKYHSVTMKDKDILNFVNDDLVNEYPKFVEFVEEYVDNI